MQILKAPFPWFGGKARIAPLIWAAFGPVSRYIEPFFGSGAVLFGRPSPIMGREIVNDLDGYVANFWRSVVHDPDAVAYHADWPVNENDLHARHVYLASIKGDFVSKIEGDPSYHDPKLAGWWVWGISAWIGSGFCSGKGPWRSVDGYLVRNLGDDGRGIHRSRPHLGNNGHGIHRQLPHLGNDGRGIQPYMQALHERLRKVWVCCGEWHRVLGDSVMSRDGITGIFLDPPYDSDLRSDVYTTDTSQFKDLGQEVRQWCINNGSDSRRRIALCGYEGEHNALEEIGWRKISWQASGGYGLQSKNKANDNKFRERIWLSPHCLWTDNERQMDLF